MCENCGDTMLRKMISISNLVTFKPCKCDVVLQEMVR
jgi:hypothetical protein